jgi:alpha,alpha-trehalose phosphorylase
MPAVSDHAAISPDEWTIKEKGLEKAALPRNESLFALANGYLGLRGNLEEQTASFHDGTYINGFFDSKPIAYGEIAYGYAKNSQTMLNIPDAKAISFTIDGEPFDPLSGRTHSHRRILDLRNGILVRDAVWESPFGRRVSLHSERLVSLVEPHLAIIRYTLCPLDGGAEIVLRSALNGSIKNQVGETDPRVGAALTEPSLLLQASSVQEDFSSLLHITRGTGFHVVSAMHNILESPSTPTKSAEEQENGITAVFRMEADRDEKITLTKYVAYHTSLESSYDELSALVRVTLENAAFQGWRHFLAAQRRRLDRFWENADIRIKGDPSLQKSLRFSLFHLFQSAGRDGRTGLSAKGLTGEGYEGHYFWDTEIYALPVFTFTFPSIARNLLEFRYKGLDKARERAKEMSQRGALYPWRTINGEECSAYYPAGTAQYHINADIIYAMRRYVRASGDEEFLLQNGAEMLFETARLWLDLGHIIPHMGDRFCISDVTGPDEYTAIVNNNTYTNLMAQDHLEYAAATARSLQSERPEEFRRIAEKIGLKAGEIDAWEQAATRMYIPFDQRLGIHPQDDAFLDKPVWDFAGTPAHRYPLLLHYHPLVIYRHQVLKQPDVVLAMFLQGRKFSAQEKKNNFDYYDPLTTGDSSLSACVQSIMASEVGYVEKAYHYFMKTARMDLEDIHGNVKYGVHTAAMAGSWMALVFGFAGMRDFDGELSFQPSLPKAWDALEFRLCFKGRIVEVRISRRKAVYSLISGDPIEIVHAKRKIALLPKHPVETRISR